VWFTSLAFESHRVYIFGFFPFVFQSFRYPIHDPADNLSRTASHKTSGQAHFLSCAPTNTREVVASSSGTPRWAGKKNVYYRTWALSSASFHIIAQGSGVSSHNAAAAVAATCPRTGVVAPIKKRASATPGAFNSSATLRCRCGFLPGPSRPCRPFRRGG